MLCFSIVLSLRKLAKVGPKNGSCEGSAGRFLTLKVCFAWQAQGFRHVAKYVAGAGVREGCENVGRRGGFEEGLKRCVSRGRRSDFALCDVDV